jgi:hypothetical protein
MILGLILFVHQFILAIYCRYLQGVLTKEAGPFLTLPEIIMINIQINLISPAAF